MELFVWAAAVVTTARENYRQRALPRSISRPISAPLAAPMIRPVVAIGRIEREAALNDPRPAASATTTQLKDMRCGA